VKLNPHRVNGQISRLKGSVALCITSRMKTDLYASHRQDFCR
jgi:hypothetical protein